MGRHTPESLLKPSVSIISLERYQIDLRGHVLFSILFTILDRYDTAKIIPLKGRALSPCFWSRRDANLADDLDLMSLKCV